MYISLYIVIVPMNISLGRDVDILITIQLYRQIDSMNDLINSCIC